MVIPSVRDPVPELHGLCYGEWLARNFLRISVLPELTVLSLQLHSEGIAEYAGAHCLHGL